jgi:hypothetical protein
MNRIAVSPSGKRFELALRDSISSISVSRNSRFGHPEFDNVDFFLAQDRHFHTQST